MLPIVKRALVRLNQLHRTPLARFVADLGQTQRIGLLAVLVLAYWAAGFWPYDFRLPLRWQPNDAAWSAAGASQTRLTLSGRGIARITPEVSTAQPTSLEVRLTLTSAGPDQSGPARILTWSPNPFERNLTVGQDGAALVLRLRREGANANGMPEIRVPRVFTGAQRELEISASGGRVRIVVDGQVAHDSAAILNGWDTAFPISLGNEPGGNRPWRGSLADAALRIDGRVVFDFAAARERVHLPAGIWRQTRRLQRWYRFALRPFQRWRWRDVVVNTLGFMPFGAFVALAFARRFRCRTLALAVASAALLSFSIEFSQLGFRGRFPSGTDFVMNCFGALLGGALTVAGVAARRAERG
ncbi:MAG: VanZ family protein [Pseudomonadota bacterium]